MGSDIGAADIHYEMQKTVNGLRYMISCENYDERYTGLPCAKTKPDPSGRLLHRCLMCQLAQKNAEIEKLNEKLMRATAFMKHYAGTLDPVAEHAKHVLREIEKK